MFTSQREKWADLDTIVLVELDLQKMRVRLVLAREAIRERMRELKHSDDDHGKRHALEGAPGNCALDK